MWLECKRKHQDKPPDYVAIKIDDIIAFEPDNSTGEALTTVYLKSNIVFTCCISYNTFLQKVADKCVSLLAK